jgi:hypothetical protein
MLICYALPCGENKSIYLWEIYKDIYKLKIKFHKYVLGVIKQTPNCAVFEDFGKFPCQFYVKKGL